MNTKRKMKHRKRKKFQTKKNKSKKNKTNKKTNLQKGSKKEILMKARNLFASVEQHHL